MNTLTQLFDWLLAASLRASLLTLATLLLQAALHRHLGARMRYALWLPVLIVLLMPVRPQSQWSIEHVFQTPPQPVQVIPAPITPTMEAAPVVFEAAAPVSEPINWQRIFQLTWLCVSAGILFIGGGSFMVTLRRFKNGRQPASEELHATLAQMAREMRLRHVPRVLIASTVRSPAVTGLLFPTLLLPAEFDLEFTPAEASLVLKHELMHLKRGDLPLNALMCVLMALHWFNPLLWIAFFKIRADREAACDAQVLHDAPSDRRIAYGHALLKVETAFCPRGFSLGFVGIFQRGAALRSRIRSIATHRAPHPAMKVLIPLCIVVMTFLGITRAQQPEPSEGAPLIALELKVIDFKKATEWNFGGRLPAKEDERFSAVILSNSEVATQTREPLNNTSASTTSYPRLVTQNNNEVVVKNIVNQPCKGGDGKLTYLPIGMIWKLKPTLKDKVVTIDIDLTDSDIIDPATGAAVSEFKGEYPTARSRVYKAVHQTAAGQSCVIFGWDDDKPQSKRPLLYIITPHVITPEVGGLPASVDLSKDGKTGENPTAGKVTTLHETDSAAAAIKTKLEKIIIPHIQFQNATVEESLEYLRVKSREHDTLAADPSQRGVSILYKAADRPSNAGITLDLKDIPLGEALRYVTELAGLKMSIQPYAVLIGSADDPALAKSAPKPSVPNPPANLGELVITALSTSVDSRTGVHTAKGDARCDVAGLSIQAAELICDRKAQQLKIIAPFTIMAGSAKHSSASDQSSAVVDLTTGKLTTFGEHTTEIVTAAPTSIILPTIEFRDATLQECVDFIRIKARELDPAKKGVNIVFKPGMDAAALITLSLKNVPVSEALRYCAELGKHKITSDGQTYVISPVSAVALAASDKAPAPNSDAAAAKAAELREAPPQQYDFAKAQLGDVLRFLATDARINFFALPDDSPINQKLVTFSIRSSPFQVLETLCRANGLVMILDHDRWLIRPANDTAQIEKSYAIPQTRASAETILKDISTLLNEDETQPSDGSPQPSAIFNKEQNSIVVEATRLQHTWVSAYFLGLSGSAQSGKTK
jgi:beta-lactamase regulating signal transducer with metallopeptidase domain